MSEEPLLRDLRGLDVGEFTKALKRVCFSPGEVLMAQVRACAARAIARRAHVQHVLVRCKAH